METFQALRETVLEDVATQPIPSFLHTLVSIFEKGHTYNRTFKLLNIFKKADQNPQTGHPAIYGAGLQLAGDYTSLGYGLNVALLAKCAQDLFNEYSYLSQSYQTFCATIQCHYPLYQPVIWKKAQQEETLIFSPSLLVYQVRMMQSIEQIHKIFQCTLSMLWQAFRLSMALRDAYLVFEGDPLARYEACTELVANWDDYHRQLQDHQEQLAEEIEKGQALADRILTRLNLQSSQSILDSLKQKIPQHPKAEAVLQEVIEVANRTIDAFYIPGKVTPLHIDFAEGKDQPPTLAPGRFAPWAGQKIEIKAVSPVYSTADPQEVQEDDFFMKLLNPLAGPLKGFLYLAQDIKQIYHKQIIEPVNPCV